MQEPFALSRDGSAMTTDVPGLPAFNELLADLSPWAHLALTDLAAAVPVVLLVWVVWTLCNAHLVRSALAGRVTVEVVPTSTFDPSEQEVGRWAGQLGRVRSSTPTVPARGAAARLRYSAEDGKMRCYLEGSASAAAVLGMPGFAEVEVRADHTRTALQPVRFCGPCTEAK